MTPNDPAAAAAAIECLPSMTKAQLLGAVDRRCDIDYLADAANIGPSCEGRTAIDLIHKARLLEEYLNLAWVGAAVAQIFLRHPWLQSVALDVSAESQYNDAGGSYVSHSLRFDAAVAAPNLRFPDEVSREEGGAFDPDAACHVLEAEHEDDAYDFAAPFLPPNAVDNVNLPLDRNTLAPVLTRGGAVSGLEVARLLWPDHEVVRRLAARPR